LCNNGVIGGSLTSNQNITTPNLLPQIISNLFTSNLGTTLSHNSSSIIYQGNIGAVIVTNNYSSSVSTAVDNINVTQNIFNGNSISLVVTGSNTSNRRTFNSNLISGRSNLINSDTSGSSFGHLVSTAILGDTLIVSASNTSNSQGGSVFVGRFNATGSLQESSQDAVFVVGTGTNAASRRNAIHVDNNNNTRITGSLLVSGSVQVSGSLVINGNTVTSTDRNGLITTGSGYSGPGQFIVGSVSVNGPLLKLTSGSLSIDDGNNASKITDFFGRNVLYKNEDLVKLLVGSSNMDQVDTQFGVASGSTNLTVLGGVVSNFRTGSYNTWLASYNVQLTSGSNNTFIANPGFPGVSFTTGSNNLIIGGFNSGQFPNSEYNDLFSLGTPGRASFMTVESTGSLKISGSFSSNTEYVDVTVNNTGSLNLFKANVWYVDDDDTPDGAHLQATNLTDGQQISIIWNANYTGTRTVTLGSNIEKTGATTGSLSLEGVKKYQIMGAVYGGKLYITPLL
jgi:hypothetical protein